MTQATMLFCVFVCLLSRAAHGQSGTGCEALLLKQDVVKYDSDTSLNYHFNNSVDEATYKRLQQELGANYAGVISGDYKNVEDGRKTLRTKTTTTFSQEGSFSILMMRTPPTAIEGYVTCRQLSSAQGFLDAIVTGDPQGTQFNVTLVWKPEQRDGNIPINRVTSNVIDGLTAPLPMGHTTFELRRRNAQEAVTGFVNGVADKAYTARIFIPAWREVKVVQRFPVGLDTLIPLYCSHRGGSSPCIVNSEVRSPPPTGGHGLVHFRIPPGSKKFRATLSHYDLQGCNGPQGNWTDQVLADGTVLDQWNMHNVGAKPVSVSIPDGAKVIELRGVDNNSSAWCDDTTWIGAVFSD